ncbi:MSHA biogenesis protein MshE [Ferrimonas sediminicola]|uniref:MSHA biogenesis protein MshE n=1 Tax=Ferrimonas sediminicola TaxID=2569538 RepID=A0A4U1BKQ1_9GAMM|nr:GspE/PulE family protein [Ferrimonas sediminicola]TKB51207.1 MSHA biogenesis protein MshE [Ferrimonas sediminicola]
MKPQLKQRLGDLLVSQEILSEEQLTQALTAQRSGGRKLGRTLIDLGFIAEEQLLSFLSRQLNVPFVDISARRLDPNAVKLLPEMHARRFRALVIDADDSQATVAMSDPADLAAYDAIVPMLAPRRLELALVTESQLFEGIDSLYRQTDRIASIAGELQQEHQQEQAFDLASITAKDADNDATVVRLLNSIFEDAIRIRASDIHIEPGDKELRIRQRVDGQLQETVLTEYGIASALVLRIKLMASLDISEKRIPQDGRFHFEVGKHQLDVRVSTMPVQFGESVVMRLLDQSAGLLELEQTGMPKEIIARLRHQINRPHGMILVTGPTGSGKTTTLYAALNELNKPNTKIITVEDPVEYRLRRINQVQVNPKIGLGFSEVLRTTLRQDPDIIMVGEMRDRETAEIGLRGAITGHLVLSTLHTNDAITSTLRLIDMGAAPYLVASALRAILAQRLVRRICPRCGEAHKPTPSQLAWLRYIQPQLAHESLAYRQGRGCQYCNHTGYRGRIGVFEMLELDEPMVEALRRGCPDEFAKAVRRSGQFRPLVDSALEYAVQGITSIEDAMRLAEDVSELASPLIDRAREMRD